MKMQINNLGLVDGLAFGLIKEVQEDFIFKNTLDVGVYFF